MLVIFTVQNVCHHVTRTTRRHVTTSPTSPGPGHQAPIINLLVRCLNVEERFCTDVAPKSLISRIK